MSLSLRFTPVRPSVYGRIALAAGVIEFAVFDADIVAIGDDNHFRTWEILIMKLISRLSLSWFSVAGI